MANYSIHQVLDLIKLSGGEVVSYKETKGQHYKVLVKRGNLTKLVVVSKTPSDRRALKNILGDSKRGLR